jgi:hypothetical protein
MVATPTIYGSERCGVRQLPLPGLPTTAVWFRVQNGGEDARMPAARVILFEIDRYQRSKSSSSGPRLQERERQRHRPEHFCTQGGRKMPQMRMKSVLKCSRRAWFCMKRIIPGVQP